MDLYSFSLVLGGAGLATMGLNSLGHHLGAGHGHGHSHGHSAGHGQAHGPSHSHAGHHHSSHGHSPAQHTGGHHGAGLVPRVAMAIFSPRILFSVLLGFGLTGMLARSWLGGPVLPVVAFAGGMLFEVGAIGPLWNFLLRFASRPALTLESCVTDLATAVTSFDREGQGLIAVEVDGQVVQVLGTLLPTDREAGLRVRAGDQVRIEEVDGARNRCVVSVP